MDNFHQNYRQWLDEALEEYNEKFGDSSCGAREFHQESIPDTVDYDPCSLVEITEDGDVYPHSHGGTGYIPRAVISWAGWNGR